MSMFRNIGGILAVSTAMTGAVVALSAATATAANAATSIATNAGIVMGGYVPPAPRRRYVAPVNVNWNRNRNANKQGQSGKTRSKNKNKNKNKQWQDTRQHEVQDQFLMRDFTLVLTPFQKSGSHSGAMPYNQQLSGSLALPYNNQYENLQSWNYPRRNQHTAVLPAQRQTSEVDPLQAQRVEANPNVRENNVQPTRLQQPVIGEIEGAGIAGPNAR